MRTIRSRARALAIVAQQAVSDTILSVRDRRVILAADLAVVYGVTTKALNQAVRRNLRRFPPDFAFRLTKDEALAVQRLRSQTVTLKRGAHFKYAPMAFTEHGAVMVATVLNSSRAVQMSVFVVRAFLRMRDWAAVHADVSRRLSNLESRLGHHDLELRAIIRTLRDLVPSPAPPRRLIGFVPPGKTEARRITPRDRRRDAGLRSRSG